MDEQIKKKKSRDGRRYCSSAWFALVQIFLHHCTRSSKPWELKTLIMVDQREEGETFIFKTYHADVGKRLDMKINLF